jgi:hypothetical protein
MSLPTRVFVPVLATLLAAAPALGGESKDPADYPLRLHIFSREERTHYNRHGLQGASQGDGRANLFAEGEVHAVDFHFDCNDKIHASIGYETYMAKWRKPGKELTVLFPVFGKSGKFFPCDIDTDVKPDLAYYTHNGHLETEPPAQFKAWMAKHNYDPEHGKDQPTAPDLGK